MKKITLFILVFACSFFSAQTITVNTDLKYKVNLPVKKSDKTPVIIMLHGYGSNEEDLFDISKSFDERFLTVSLRAPFAAEGQGYSWYKLDFLPQKQFKYDYKQVKESRAKILAFISSFCKAYKADSTQVFLLGYSQGTIMAYEVALAKPEKIKGVVALSGLILDETKKIKFDAFKLANVKFFIGHGNMDNVIDFKKGEEAAKYLQSKKNNVIFKSYDMPHAMVGKELNDIKSWLKSNIEKEKKAEVKK
ncbi:MAG: dienelactone hydrolase family protein [Bacteroidetes bacterium]|nr:dienelactone hydrolase family protein [Bacteroidota bacterium]